jgi:N-acetylglutamate synthase and related acetyltransferases
MDNRNVRFAIHSGAMNNPDILAQLQQLFDVGAFWAKGRTCADLAVAWANSEPVVTAWDGDRLIGHARAISDGVFRATIWDVVIHPDYQGRGLGRKLVQTVLAHPKLARVERVYLTTTNQQEFYARIGFVANSSTTMVLYNNPSQQFSNPAEVNALV